MNTVISVSGPLATRYAGLSWRGNSLRGLGMLSPMLPSARVVKVAARELAWLAKDGTLVRATLSSTAPLQLRLNWPNAGAGITATRLAPGQHAATSTATGSATSSPRRTADE